MKELSSTRKGTKKRIFDAAVELFAERGFRETTMRDIADKTGIKAASIYNHYASKETIMEDLLDSYLDRMELFYSNLNETALQVSEGADLEQLMQQLMLTYAPDEVELMYRLTRIVYHEQFHFEKAAEALIGSGFRKYVGAHEQFFDRLCDAGLMLDRGRNKAYAELFARISVTFAFQFLHPTVVPTLEDQSLLYPPIISVIAQYEKSLLEQARREAAGGAE